MTRALGDEAAAPVVAMTPWTVIAQADVTIGAAGAVGTIDGDPDITFTHGGTGIYNITYPQCSKAKILTNVISPGTIGYTRLSARNAPAGTATVQTLSAGALVDPASGDVVTVVILGASR